MELTCKWDECEFEAIEPLRVLNEHGRDYAARHKKFWRELRFEDFL